MKFPRTFPDAALCRTRHVDGDVYRCLADEAGRCPHALPFAYNHYCRHADRRTFTGKTWDAVAAADDGPWQLYTLAVGE